MQFCWYSLLQNVCFSLHLNLIITIISSEPIFEKCLRKSFENSPVLVLRFHDRLDICEIQTWLLLLDPNHPLPNPYGACGSHAENKSLENENHLIMWCVWQEINNTILYKHFLTSQPTWTQIKSCVTVARLTWTLIFIGKTATKQTLVHNQSINKINK